MISICLRSVHVVSSVSLSNLFFSQNSFPQRFAGVQFMSPIYFIFSCRTIDRGCFGLSLIYQTIGNTSSFPMISSLICLLVYSRSYTRFIQTTRSTFLRSSEPDEPSICFTFSCHTIDRRCFGLRFLYQTIEKTSSFPMISSMTWFLVYSRSYTCCSGLQFPIFFDRASQPSRGNLSNLIGLEPFSRRIRLLSLNRSPFQPPNMT